MASTDQFQPPPTTRRGDFREILHGVEVPDPYRWLEDGAAPETRAWLSAQKEYARPFLDTPIRERIRARLAESMKIDAMGFPIERKGYYFYARRRAGEQHAAICRRHGLNGQEEILVDANTMSADQMTGVHIVGISRDGSVLAYGVRHGGEDEFSINLMDVASRRDLSDQLPRARYNNASWKHDGRGFYYAVRTDQGPRIRFHRMGTGISEDREIIGSDWGPERWAGAFVSDNGRYLMIGSGYRTASTKSGDRNDPYFQRLDPEGEIIPIADDLDAFSTGSDAGDAFIMLTNWQAPRRRVIRVEFANPSRENWREIIPEGPATIESVATVGGKLVVASLEEVRSRVRVFEPDGTFVREVELPGAGTAAGFTGRWERSESFFYFSSFDHAPTIYRYDLATGERDVWWRQQNIPDLAQFELRQVWYPSKDGTRIPMYLFHKRGLVLDSARPTLLTGYGGYNLSMLPAYSTMAMVWAEAGGVFASANIRGGGEFGEEWHQAGRRERKQNVFDDFIAAAEWLVANRYTQSSKLAISGGSNGGLLVGAALTQRPDLFRAVICHRPVLDMMRHHKDPLGPYWIGEYGCADDPKDFRYLLAYSPYHNVRGGTRYPAVMFVTGDSDTRCDPMHARKMAAMLQSATASKHPIVLHYRAEAGHMATLPMDATIDELADQLAFLSRELDVAF
ncbi:MAG TPA: prolyl oligopeptidase family serine peptidase [Candidatus Binatus sp.]|uniref:prolyl oligopeptidase family serine peptidase n=1 Tax=Candidatus Binatus sp. TaxID=2811406 RepID=UPI002F402E0A